MKKFFLIAVTAIAAIAMASCSKEYADINHTHDQYADVNHTHDQYADVNHHHNETQTKVYNFSIHFDATSGDDGDCWADAVTQISQIIQASDAVLVYGKSRLWSDEEAYDAWPVAYNMLGYNYTVLFGTKYIAFKRYHLGAMPAEDIAMKVVVIPASVVVKAKAAHVDVNNYADMVGYLQSNGEVVETIESVEI